MVTSFCKKNALAPSIQNIFSKYSSDVPMLSKNVRNAVRTLNKRPIEEKTIFSIHLMDCHSFLLNHFEVSQSIHDGFFFFRCTLWNNLFLLFRLVVMFS